MAYTDEKLRQFEEYIKQSAALERDMIASELSDYREQELKSAEETVLGEAYNIIQARIADMQKELFQSLSRTRFNAHKELLEYRAALEDEFFSQLKKRLFDFTETGAYKDYLTRAADKVLTSVSAEDYTAQLREQDVALFSLACGGRIKAEPVSGISIGGVKIVTGRLIADYTLDSALKKSRESFYERSGLSIHEDIVLQ